MSITRRDFLRVSGGVAAGAALAGLGLSVNPPKAQAVVGVDDALLGAGVLGLAGLLGVALGYKTYTDIQNGVPDAVGGSFSGYLADRANEAAIVSAAGADAATVVGAGYSEAQLKEAYARGAWADGLAQSITSTGAGALDWLNARTMDAALAWGALKSWFGGLGANPSSPITSSAVLTSAAEVVSSIPYFEKVVSSSLPFPDGFLMGDYPDSTFYVKDYFNVAPDAVEGVDYTFFESSGRKHFRALTSKCPHCSLNSKDGTFSGWSTYSGNQYGAPEWACPIGNFSFTVINPAMDKAVDTPQSIDPASWGFGVPVIGTDSVINGDTLTSTGHLLAPGTVGEMMGDGTLTVPWADMVWGAGLGLGDASVRGIEGDASLPLGVSIPADIPVTVSIPISDSAYGEKTMTLEDALSSGIDTSISRTIETPVPPVEGTPFYPVIPPGSSGAPSSELPFQGIGWQDIFPFNMLYSLISWIGDNL